MFLWQTVLTTGRVDFSQITRHACAVTLQVDYRIESKHVQKENPVFNIHISPQKTNFALSGLLLKMTSSCFLRTVDLQKKAESTNTKYLLGFPCLLSLNKAYVMLSIFLGFLLEILLRAQERGYILQLRKERVHLKPILQD